MPDVFLDLPLSEQAEIIRIAAPKLGMPAPLVEKDVWVCWALEHLFAIPDRHQMAFKGGTSLSKVYNAIQRFSEDIDITVDYRSLSGENLPDNISPSGAKKLSEKLRSLLKVYSSTVIKPYFEDLLSEKFPDRICAVELSGDGERLWIKYQSAIAEELSYVPSNVLVEFGGRNITEPAETFAVVTYLSQQTSGIQLPVASVNVLALARTFWEKATLIHVECNRGAARPNVNRLSRHWSDMAKLGEHALAADAIANRKLLADVVKHKKIFFDSRFAYYDKCLTGGLKLAPKGELKASLEHDYRAMIDSGMFTGDPAPFEKVIESLEKLERRINTLR